VIAPVETCNTVRGDLLEKPVALWGFVLLGRNNMPTSAVCVAGFSANESRAPKHYRDPAELVHDNISLDTSAISKESEK
jgi:hypothetical protein